MLKKIWSRISNTKSIVAIVGGLVSIITTWGINIPDEKIMYTVQGLCAIAVIIGVLNDKGMTTTKFNK